MRGSVRLAALSGTPRHLRLDPRLGRAGRGRPDPPAGRALRRAPRDPEPVVRSGRATPTRRRPRGRWRSRARTDRSRCRSPARSSRPLPETADKARDGVAHGGYIVRESSGGPEAIDLILIATGSELPLAAAAAESLTAEGVRTRVVSLPCWELFELQPADLPRDGPAAGRPASGSAWRPACPWAGNATSATRARSSRSTTSARAPRPRRSSSTSASRRSRRRPRPARRARRAARADPDGRPGHQPVGLRLGGPALGHGGDAEPAR